MIYYILILISDIFKNTPFFILQNSVYIFGLLIFAKTLKLKKLKNKSFTVLFLLILLILYIFALAISLLFGGDNFISQVQHFLYIVVPILLVISLLTSNINLAKISKINHGLIITFFFVSFVGAIQFFFDPSFLANRFTEIQGTGIAQVYKVIPGLNQKFLKINSIFTSADRFSAISQSIFLISLFNLKIEKLFRKNDKKLFISYMGLIISAFSLIISGTRSRIFSLIIGGLIVLSFYILTSIFTKKEIKIPKGLLINIFYSIPFLSGILFFFPNLITNLYSSFGLIRILFNPNSYTEFISRFIGQTGIRQEVVYSGNWFRVIYASDLKSTSEILFGNGLGSVASGKPGEATILSTLSESGYLLGSLILVILSILVISNLNFCLRKINYKNSTFIYILSIVALDLLLSLIIGLVYFFEPCHLIILLPTLVGCQRIVDLNLSKSKKITTK